MSRDPRYDILFEPVRIGPVIAKNRFYQVPHCTGMGWMRPEMLAAMRETKAEGGWGVVCTEYTSIHPSSDDLPHISASLWNDRDIYAHSLMTERVHAHGALAGVELWHGGARSPNNLTREVALDLDSLPNLAGHPWQTRAMDKTDIGNLRRWHRKAALRARQAGFDIVYVYATHGYLLSNFLDPRMNSRSDEYGGSLENRVRLVRELIEETKSAVGDRCAVAVRFSADEETGEDGQPRLGERREMLEILAELPDLWDINIADYSLEMGASRFVKEGALEPYMSFVRSVTSKPVVTVGRFTSPDTMVSQVRRGVTDLIGAARPSIADPFLPKKIEEGRIDDIRECIGCNICYSSDSLSVAIRCTQNPAMGEEWRKLWHPENVPPKRTDARVLVVGGGPAGLEAARTLGARGYHVILAEATRTLGGRISREAGLPGMEEYIRVRDYRTQQLLKMPNVEIFLDSSMTAADVHAVEAQHVVIATGASWRREYFDGQAYCSIVEPGADPAILTPDDIMDGRFPDDSVVIYDGDGYYMGVAVAERLVAAGVEVTFATSSDSVAPWASRTYERWRMRRRLMERGVKIVAAHDVKSFDARRTLLACCYTGAEKEVDSRWLVMVGQRAPDDRLYKDLLTGVDNDASRLPFSLTRIGDCEAPSIIAAAVYAGHRYGRQLETVTNVDNPLRHERTGCDAWMESAVGSSERSSGNPYCAILLRYYEKAVIRDICFLTLADHFGDAASKLKLRTLGSTELRVSSLLKPVLDKHDLTARPSSELELAGRALAAKAPDNWHGLVRYLAEPCPEYANDIEALKRIAPQEDFRTIKFAGEYESAIIEFFRMEQVDDKKSMARLQERLMRV